MTHASASSALSSVRSSSPSTITSLRATCIHTQSITSKCWNLSRHPDGVWVTFYTRKRDRTLTTTLHTFFSSVLHAYMLNSSQYKLLSGMGVHARCSPPHTCGRPPQQCAWPPSAGSPVTPSSPHPSALCSLWPSCLCSTDRKTLFALADSPRPSSHLALTRVTGP